MKSTARTRMRRSNVAAVVAVAALTAIALSACSAGDTTGGDAPAPAAAVDPKAPEVDKLIGVQYRATSAAPFLAAQDEGIAKEYGISLEPSWAESSAAAMTQIVSGDGQVGTVSAWSVVDAANQGIDVKIIGEAFRSATGSNTLEVLPDSPIKSIADLTGKKVAVTSLNSGHDFRLKYALQQEGLDPEGPEYVELPYGEMAAALEKGTIDAATVTGVAQRAVRDTLNSRSIFDYTGGMYEGFTDLQWVTSAAFAEANPNAVAAFQCAVVEKGEQLVTDDDDVYASMLKTYLGFDDATVAATVKVIYPATLDAKKLQLMPDIMFSLGKIDKKFDINDVVIPMPTNCG